jgi:hypothetical protein
MPEMNNCKRIIYLIIVFFLFLSLFKLNLNILTTNSTNQEDIENNIFGYLIIILIITLLQTATCVGFLKLCDEFLQKQYKKLHTKWVNYKKQKKFSSEIEITGDLVNCCICLDNMEKGIKLKCNHVIHKECLHNMMNYDIKKCPLCCQNFV